MNLTYLSHHSAHGLGTSWSILEPEAPPEANESRTVSLGSCPVRASTPADLRNGLSVSDRESLADLIIGGLLVTEIDDQADEHDSQTGETA